MSWRIVSVSKRSHLSLRSNNLIIKQDVEFSVPLEDIGALLLEDQSITASVALLDACVHHKIALYICDEKHLPSGLLLGYQQHSRQSKVIESQLNLSKPLKKRLWQFIVKQKIANQKSVFETILKCSEPTFDTYASSVNSGDTLNREATVARLYFSKLLPEGVSRNSEHIYNSALNYGYSIIRGALARSLVSYGFLTSIGIKHSSELDNFALADDLMEVYRPYVDYFVFRSIPIGKECLDKEMRANLVALLVQNVEIGGGTCTMLRAMEVTAKSLVTAINEKDFEKLLLPKLI